MCLFSFVLLSRLSIVSQQLTLWVSIVLYSLTKFYDQLIQSIRPNRIWISHPHQTMNEQELIQACKDEKDVRVKERLLLARQVLFDDQTASHVAKSLGHVRSWAYKWLDRFKEYGADGMHDRQRTGRPPKIPRKKLAIMEKQIAEGPSGRSAKQVMGLIYEKTGTKYHEVHVYGPLHRWGCAPREAQKRLVNSATMREKQDFKNMK